MGRVLLIQHPPSLECEGTVVRHRFDWCCLLLGEWQIRALRRVWGLRWLVSRPEAEIGVTARICILYGEFSGRSDTWNIPAGTGRVTLDSSEPWPCSVYPRAYGVPICRYCIVSLMCGIPPRVRGSHMQVLHRLPDVRHTPACTGFPPIRASHILITPAYPRRYGASVSGDCGTAEARGIPPSVQGNQRYRRPHGSAAGQIPACAGQLLLSPGRLRLKLERPCVKGMYELKGAGRSIREISRELGLFR